MFRNEIRKCAERYQPKPKLTTEEKISLLKKKYSLSHGKGKRKKKSKK